MTHRSASRCLLVASSRIVLFVLVVIPVGDALSLYDLSGGASLAAIFPNLSL